MESCRWREKKMTKMQFFSEASSWHWKYIERWTEDLGEFFESEFAILDHSLRSKTHVILNAMPKMCQAFLISLGVTYHIVNSKPHGSSLKVHSPWFTCFGWILATLCDVVNPTGAIVILEGNGNIPCFRTKCRWGEIIHPDLSYGNTHNHRWGETVNFLSGSSNNWLDTAIKNEQKMA